MAARTWNRDVSCLTVLLLTVSVHTHVRLVYPPAFSTGDFLDNYRTIPPCGQQITSELSRTKLQSGLPVEVTWHLPYAHYGGHALQVVNTTVQPGTACDYAILANLTIDPMSLADAATHAQNVTIPPGLGCGPSSTCALRLLRSAAEWGGKYTFWSCAAIEVDDDAAGLADSHTASTNECETDTDCGPIGQALCVDIKGTTAPRMQCFCKAGFHGPGCAMVSRLSRTWAAAPDG